MCRALPAGSLNDGRRLFRQPLEGLHRRGYSWKSTPDPTTATTIRWRTSVTALPLVHRRLHAAIERLTAGEETPQERLQDAYNQSLADLGPTDFPP